MRERGGREADRERGRERRKGIRERGGREGECGRPNERRVNSQIWPPKVLKNRRCFIKSS